MCAVLDREVSLDLELAALADVHGAGDEADLRVVLAVEEVSSFEVACEVLVFDGDRVDVDCALKARSAVLAGGQRALVLLEPAAERRDDHVLDGKADVGMDLVDRPRPGGDWLCCGCAHWNSLVVVADRSPFTLLPA
jgi:hypothetical protein